MKVRKILKKIPMAGARDVYASRTPSLVIIIVADCYGGGGCRSRRLLVVLSVKKQYEKRKKGKKEKKNPVAVAVAVDGDGGRILDASRWWLFRKYSLIVGNRYQG